MKIALDERWCLQPRERARDVSAGDSFIIELLTACALYKHHARARLAQRGRPKTSDHIIALIQNYCDATQEAADAFWRIMRAGLAHEAMPVLIAENQSFPWPIDNDE